MRQICFLFERVLIRRIARWIVVFLLSVSSHNWVSLIPFFVWVSYWFACCHESENRSFSLFPRTQLTHKHCLSRSWMSRHESQVTKKLSRTYPLDCAQGPDNKKFLHETNTAIQYICRQTTKDHSTYISSSESSYIVNTSTSCMKAQIIQI